MKKRELAVGARLDPRDARDPRRAAHGRRSARVLGRPARLAARGAARDPARRDRAARHAPPRDAAVPRHRRALPDARALPPALAQHALQPPEGAHARGRRGAATGSPAPASRSATRACCCAGSTTTRRRCRRSARAWSGCACAPTTATRRSCSRAPRTSACRSRRASRCSARCAAARAASRSRSTCSTRRTARCRSRYPYLRGREGDDVVVETYDGRIWREPNPPD